MALARRRRHLDRHHAQRPACPKGMLGKIGVAVSPMPVGGRGWGRVWALVEAEDGALFRSDDGGSSWERASEFSGLRTRPWYYMHVTADPCDPDTVYVQNYRLWKSIDAGRTFLQVPTGHGDDHALWIDPAQPAAHDRRQRRRRLRLVQRRPVLVVDLQPADGAALPRHHRRPVSVSRVCLAAGQHRDQHSRAARRSARSPSATGSSRAAAKAATSPIKHDDNDYVVASGPIGRRFTNDIMYLHDHKTQQDWQNTVWPELYGWGVGAETLKYRFNWTFPIHYSRHDPDVLWVASQYLHRSTDNGASWEVISKDLTRNDRSKLGPSGGPITRDNTGAEVYCTIFAFAESPQRRDRLWCGTDDGLVHRSEDGGRNWTNITPDGTHAKVSGGRRDALPEWALISIVEASPHDEDTLYVAATRYKHDDTRPYLYKTADRGKTWRKITGGMPDGEFTRTIREDPSRKGLLYCGTETAIYVSFDDGGTLASARRQSARRADLRPGHQGRGDGGGDAWSVDLDPRRPDAASPAARSAARQSREARRQCRCGAVPAARDRAHADRRRLRRRRRAGEYLARPGLARHGQLRANRREHLSRAAACLGPTAVTTHSSSMPARTRPTAWSSTTICPIRRRAR